MTWRLFFLHFWTNWLTNTWVVFRLAWLLNMILRGIFIEVCTVVERSGGRFLCFSVFQSFLVIKVICHLTSCCNFCRLTTILYYLWLNNRIGHVRFQSLGNCRWVEIGLFLARIRLLIAPKERVKIWNLITCLKLAKDISDFYYQNESRVSLFSNDSNWWILNWM